MVYRSLVTLALVFGVAQCANADFVRFNAATGSYVSYSESGLTFTPLAPSTTFDIDTGGSGIGGTGKWDSSIFDASDDNAEISIGSGTFSLISVYVDHADTGDPIEWRAFLGAANVGTEVLPGSHPDNTTYAFSILNSLVFDRVEVRSLGSDFNDWELDDLEFVTQSQGVPEPTSLALLGMGVAGLGGYRLRRKRHQAA